MTSAGRDSPILLPSHAESNVKQSVNHNRGPSPKTLPLEQLEIIWFLIVLGTTTSSSYPQWLLDHILCPFSLRY